MNMKKILVSLVAGAVMTTAFAISAMAADVTVKTDDELEAALGTAAADDTIILEAGEYQAFDLARNSELNFKGMDGATVIASDSNSCYWPCFTGTVENIVFKAAENYSYPYNYSAIIFAHDTNNGEPCDITFKNCDFISSNGNSGIHFVGDVDFYNCDFVGNDSYSAMNYCCPSGDGIVIDGCTFNGTYSFASIHLAEGVGADTTISDCEINTGLIEFGSPKNIEFSENVINSTINLWGENNVIFDNNQFDAEAKISANSDQAVATILSTNTYANGMTAEDIIVSEKDGTVVFPVAKIGDVEYMTLQAAVEAVEEGETIKLIEDITFTKGANGTTNGISYNRGVGFVLDLNGKTITSGLGNIALRFKIGDGNGVVDTDVEITIKNGTVVSTSSNWCAISAASADNSGNTITMNLQDLVVESNKAGDYAVKAWSGTTLKAKDVTINANKASGGFYAVGGKVVLDDCTVVQEGLHTAPYMSMALGVSGGGTMTVNSGEYSSEPTAASEGYNQGTSHGSWVAGVMSSGGTLVINDGTFANGNFGDDRLATAARGLLFADKGGNIEVTGGTFNALKYVFDLQNNLGVTPNPHAEVSGGIFNADPRIVIPSYNTDKLEIADGYTVLEYADGNYAVVADEFIGNESITVDFVDVTDTEAEGEKLYNINLVASTDKVINRLNSVDLTFVLDQILGENEFEIIASNDEVAINPVDNSDVRYEFHYEGKDDADTDTASTITIGQVKFTGYGKFNFAVDTTATTNAAHATEALDNIVDTFVPGGSADGLGDLVIDGAKVENVLISVPTRDLVINVAFPNSVKTDNNYNYQAMKVVVSGGDLAEAIVVDLGANAVMPTLTTDVKTEAAVSVATTDKYVVTLTDALTVNTSYNVEVSGAGYRTARYTVTMNCDDYKTLNFWNNVKDNAVEVEEKKDSSKKNVTFLAGDIVKDAVINIYDLSAVVSYFGEIDLSETNNKAYAKYDLNRDGKIDSKDVAYVLVSWGK